MENLDHFVHALPHENDFLTQPRPYFNHSVEFKRICTPEERTRALEAVGLNVFYFPADMVSGCDMLSDSGTTTMTNEQWAALHLGDESYGSNRGYYQLMDQIGKTFGENFTQDQNFRTPNVFLFHQGRPAENALFTTLGRLGPDQIIPSNGHFDTTEANIENNHIKAINLFSPDFSQESSNIFKGDMDISRLQELLKSSAQNIPVIYLTITNNTGGGQPVSLKNIRDVQALSREHNVPFFLDACRFAENAWFIQQHEEGYRDKTIDEIVHEMFDLADGFTISFKKDGLANMGGGLFLRKNGLFVEKYPQIPDELMNQQIITEAHPTYGGISGRDIMALVKGLQTITRPEYLAARIGQVQEFGHAMDKAGLPVMVPTGGHAVYLDMNKFFEGTDMQPSDFGGISFTALLLAAYGHRACELGNFAFGSYDPVTQTETLPEMNFVRFAIPRLRYERQDLQSVVEAIKALHDNRDQIPKVDVTYGRNLPLRHFKARFAFR
ncbi:MAG TPA: tryptophanase [Candidatus Saccharimonadales bacterium]|jgi:tryptophanase|nr:tryptophanase [Candidatus Saccharimonadales bacterium]